MGLLRDRLFEILSEADEHGRLRLLFPRVADESGDESSQVYVHAKLVIADDRIFKVGSSNLSNRSMRVDSEVDLVIERPEPEAVIRDRLADLLAVHFGESPETVRSAIESHEGSLVKGLDSLVTETGHSLRPYPFGCDSEFERKLADTQLLDPDEPLDPNHWIRNFVPEDDRPSTLRRITQISVVVAVGLLLAFLVEKGWGSVIDKEQAVTWLEAIQADPWSPAILLAIFVVAGLTGIPLNLFLVAATIVMGPWIALACGYAGAHLSATAAFGLGHRFGKPLLRKWNSRKVERLNEKLRDRGVLSVALLRLVPVAPFGIINLAIGASPLRFGVFNLGTLIGMAPGMAAVVLLTHQLNEAVSNPGWGSILGFVAILLVVAGVLFTLRRALRSRSSAPDG